LWWCPSDKWLVIDEFHFVCPVNDITGSMSDTLRLARKRQLGLVGVSQRIADVHKLFTSCCRMVVLFWTTEARDLIAIKDRFGDDVAERVRNLRPLLYNDITKEVTQTPQCIVIRKGSLGAETVDL
jgi:DNA helicase HerA-like ATPase